MRWRFFAIAVFLATSGCGKPTRDTGQFEKYVQDFEKASRDQGHPITVEDIKIEFGDAHGFSGQCHQGTFQTPTIVVDRKMWKAGSEDFREWLIFHELGHCVLERPHLDSEDVIDGVGGIPTSLMSSKSKAISYFPIYREHYIHELFDPGQ